MTTRIYHLFVNGWQVSCRTEDYHGTIFYVAATSIRQAYAVAHKHVWIDPSHPHPVGILAIEDQRGRTLWCGCSGHNVQGGLPRHYGGITALRDAMAAHHCPKAPHQALSAPTRPERQDPAPTTPPQAYLL